jgi:flavin reductase (DIM6/NTAB) family NADH-FMN oxidoreductase RutF
MARTDLLTQGVYVMAASHGGRIGGLTVAWATQVTASRVMVSVGKQSSTRQLVLASGAFGLSALRPNQIELARHFGKTSKTIRDKFEGVAWHPGQTGSPLLDDCAAALDCRVEKTLELDDGHILIVAQVVDAKVSEGALRLIYNEDEY